MDFSNVAPPSQNSNIESNTAFADAVARARQIAAKIQHPKTPGGAAAAPALGGDVVSQGVKRPYEDPLSGGSESKKLASINDPIGAQLRAIAEQQSMDMTDPLPFNMRSSQNAAVMAAHEAAQAINNQKFGIMSAGGGNGGPQGGGPNPMGGSQPGQGGGLVEEIKIPHKMVGLVIGRNGEQIGRLQLSSGCKVQIAPDAGDMAPRSCTLSGSAADISKAKQLIDQIINKTDEGECTIEVKIPGNKVGLVIGKGGETIRQLQERAQCKMVMIQDTNQPSDYAKPLKITGEKSKCRAAESLVLDLIADKDIIDTGMMGDQGGFGRMGGGGGGGGQHKENIDVPRGCVGQVIGRGGEMIKKIQSSTGAKVQFNQDDEASEQRTCTIMGSQSSVELAMKKVYELVHEVQIMQQNQGGFGRGSPGPGRGRGGPRSGPNGFGRGRGNGGGSNGYGGGGMDPPPDATYSVPADKCGFVIGKGGETIKRIIADSKAHVELQRGPPPNPNLKVFNIFGNDSQVQQAVELICLKAGLSPPGPNPMAAGSGAGSDGGRGGMGAGMQEFDQFRQPGGDSNGRQGQQPAPPGGSGGPPSYAPQGWGNAYQQWQQQNSSNPAKQAADDNAAQWQAYYSSQYYGGQGGQPGQPAAQQPPQTTAPAAAAGQTAGAQPDYSEQWADYYRTIGREDFANAVLLASQQQQQGGTGGQPAAPAPQSAGMKSPGQPEQYQGQQYSQQQYTAPQQYGGQPYSQGQYQPYAQWQGQPGQQS